MAGVEGVTAFVELDGTMGFVVEPAVGAGTKVSLTEEDEVAVGSTGAKIDLALLVGTEQLLVRLIFLSGPVFPSRLPRFT